MRGQPFTGGQPTGCVLATLALALRVPPLTMNQAAVQRSQLQLDQDRAIAARAEKERSLLQEGTALEVLVQKGGRVDSGAGFGAAKPKGGVKKAKAKAKAKAKPAAKREPPRSVLGKELQRSGVVRVSGALSAATADALREFVDAERELATSEVTAGLRKQDERSAAVVQRPVPLCGECAPVCAPSAARPIPPRVPRHPN